MQPSLEPSPCSGEDAEKEEAEEMRTFATKSWNQWNGPNFMYWLSVHVDGREYTCAFENANDRNMAEAKWRREFGPQSVHDVEELDSYPEKSI